MLARAAVRFHPGQHVLDLGCGPGTDARLLATLGLRVRGVDVSRGMVEQARARGVDAAVGSLDEIEGAWDGALSNFGALNCLPSLERLGTSLRRALPCGAWFLAVVMGPRCPAEDVALLLRGRRPRRGRPVSVEGIDVPTRFLSVDQVAAELGDGFRVVRTEALGALVRPPDLGGTLLGARVDAALGAWPVVRGLGDHTLIELRRT